MASNFSRLPAEAKRAAFAAMDRDSKPSSKSKSGGSSGRKTSGKPGSSRSAEQRVGTLKRGRATAPVTNPTPGGGFATSGTISRERAAEIMFGTAGAARRIRKANAKKR